MGLKNSASSRAVPALALSQATTDAELDELCVVLPALARLGISAAIVGIPTAWMDAEGSGSLADGAKEDSRASGRLQQRLERALSGIDARLGGPADPLAAPPRLILAPLPVSRGGQARALAPLPMALPPRSLGHVASLRTSARLNLVAPELFPLPECIRRGVEDERERRAAEGGQPDAFESIGAPEQGHAGSQESGDRGAFRASLDKRQSTIVAWESARVLLGSEEAPGGGGPPASSSRARLEALTSTSPVEIALEAAEEAAERLRKAKRRSDKASEVLEDGGGDKDADSSLGNEAATTEPGRGSGFVAMPSPRSPTDMARPSPAFIESNVTVEMHSNASAAAKLRALLVSARGRKSDNDGDDSAAVAGEASRDDSAPVASSSPLKHHSKDLLAHAHTCVDPDPSPPVPFPLPPQPPCFPLPTLRFLGTGCAEPSRHRGSSAIWLELPGQSGLRCRSDVDSAVATGPRSPLPHAPTLAPLASSGSFSVLLDAGEGAAGALLRSVGEHAFVRLVDSLEVIFISHLHADHATGLAGVLRARSVSLPSPLVVGPKRLAASLTLAGLDASSFVWAGEFSKMQSFAPGGRGRGGGWWGAGRWGGQAGRAPGQAGSLVPPSRPHPRQGGQFSSAVRARLAALGLEIETCPADHCPDSWCVRIVVEGGRSGLVDAAGDLGSFGDPGRCAAERAGKPTGLVLRGHERWKSGIGGLDSRAPRAFPAAPRVSSPLALSYSGDGVPRPGGPWWRLAQRSTVVVQEATFARDRPEDAARKRHATVPAACALARASGAALAVLTHFSQRYPGVPEETPEDVVVAFDGMVLPLASLFPNASNAPAVVELVRRAAASRACLEDRDEDEDEAGKAATGGAGEGA